ncbi:MCE family protein [Actinomadura rayongensis]|uniref:MCE family protein n=1 Tax=Actinomadura rayongensis TaxID=1429076 RepID=A0A6I4WDY1_9ACTN|nr:MlaD family protein [Actinomadura rayongensis]MXQ67968.1 MCE family protein [Actinomadura rayongensis]
MHASRTPGVIGVVVLALTATLLVWLAWPSAGGRRYTAVFDRAGAGLDAGRSEVKVRGITVGKVERVALRPDGSVLVRLRSTVPIPASTHATIEPVSFFGPKDVALDLGTGPALPEGGRITATAPVTDATDLAGPAYALTRAIDPDEVASLLHTFGAGLRGEENALRRTLINGATVVDATHRRSTDLKAIVDDLAGIGAVLADRGNAITGAVDDLNGLAPVIYDRPDRVAKLLDEASHFAATTGGVLDRQGAHLGKIIDGTAPAVGVLAAQSPRIGQLIDVLDGFFHGLASLMNTPGPQGTLLGQGLNTLSLDFCKIFIDVC